MVGICSIHATITHVLEKCNNYFWKFNEQATRCIFRRKSPSGVDRSSGGVRRVGTLPWLGYVPYSGATRARLLPHNYGSYPNLAVIKRYVGNVTQRLVSGCVPPADV